MAWSNEWIRCFPTVSQSTDVSSLDQMAVSWCRKNDDVTTEKKFGQFTHTMDDAKTFAVNKADILALVNAETGTLP